MALGFGTTNDKTKYLEKYKNNLISYWRLNETSGNFIDAVTGDIGVSQGNLVYDYPGIIDRCPGFNSFDAWINLAQRDDYKFEKDRFSISIWLKPTAFNAGAGVFGIDLVDYGWVLRMGGSSGQIDFGVREDNGTYTSVTMSGVSFDTWNHIVAVYDHDQIWLYRDLSNVVTTRVNTYLNTKTVQNYQIGYYDYAGAGKYFAGFIDEVAVFNESLNVLAINELYNHGAALGYTARELTSVPGFGNFEVDNSENNLLFVLKTDEKTNSLVDEINKFSGVQQGSPSYNESGFSLNTKSVKYNTTSDYHFFNTKDDLVFPTDTDNFTVCYRFKLGSGSIPFGWGNVQNQELYFNHSTSNTFQIVSNGSTVYSATSSGMNDGSTWHTLVAIRSSGVWSVYLDKVDLSGTTNTDSYDLSDKNFVLGGRSYGDGVGNVINGYISEFYVWNSTLTQTQIDELYDNDLYYIQNEPQYTGFMNGSLDQHHDNLIVCLPLDEDSTGKVVDIRSKHYIESSGTGLVFQDPDTQVVESKGSLKFDTNDGRFYLGYSSLWPKEECTVSFWMKSRNRSTTRGTVLGGLLHPTDVNFADWTPNFIAFIDRIYCGIINANNYDSGTYLCNEFWHYFTFIIYNKSLLIYRNGIQYAHYYHNGEYPERNFDKKTLEMLFNNALIVGTQRIDSTNFGLGTYDTWMDHWLMWNKALSLDDIEYIHNNHYGRQYRIYHDDKDLRSADIDLVGVWNFEEESGLMIVPNIIEPVDYRNAQTTNYNDDFKLPIVYDDWRIHNSYIDSISTGGGINIAPHHLHFHEGFYFKYDTNDYYHGNQSLVFDGELNSYIRSWSRENFSPVYKDFTFEFVVKCEAYQDVIPIGGHNGANSSNSWRLWYDNVENKFSFIVRQSSTTTAYYHGTFSLSLDNWYHIAVVRNGTDLQIYVDGTALTLDIDTAIGTSYVPYNNEEMFIGYAYSVSSTYYAPKMKFDLFRISIGIARWTSNFTKPTSFTKDAYDVYYCDFESDNWHSTNTGFGNLLLNDSSDNATGIALKKDLVTDFSTSVIADLCYDESDSVDNSMMLVAYYDSDNFVKIQVNPTHINGVCDRWEAYMQHVEGGSNVVNIDAEQLHERMSLKIVKQGNTFNVYYYSPVDVVSGTTATQSSYVSPNSIDRLGSFAIDDDDTTAWISDNRGVDEWLQVDLGTAKIAKGYSIYYERPAGISGYFSDYSPLDYEFQGSNNASSWTTLDIKSYCETSNNYQRLFYCDYNTTAYRYYRILCHKGRIAGIDNPNQNVAISRFQIFETMEIGLNDSGWQLLQSTAFTNLPDKPCQVMLLAGNRYVKARYKNFELEIDTPSPFYTDQLTSANTVNYGYGTSGQSMVFNGSTDYLFQDNTLLENEEYTVSMWVKSYVNNSDQTISVRTVTDPTTDYSAIMGINSSGNFYHNAKHTTLYQTVTGTTSIEEYKWYHVTITGKSNDFIRLYVNGVEEGTAGAVTTLDLFDKWMFGRAANISNYFNGEIDCLSVWKKQLSDTEILAHYNYTKPNLERTYDLKQKDLYIVGAWNCDDDGTGNNIVDKIFANDANENGIGTMTYELTGVNGIGKCISLNNESLTAGNIAKLPNGTNNFGISYWIKSGSNTIPIGFGSASDERFIRHRNSNIIELVDHNNSVYIQATITSLNDGVTWHNYLFVRESNYWKLFIDGEYIHSATSNVDNYNYSNRVTVFGARAILTDHSVIAGLSTIYMWDLEDTTLSKQYAVELFNEGRGTYLEEIEPIYGFRNAQLDTYNDNLVNVWKFENNSAPVDIIHQRRTYEATLNGGVYTYLQNGNGDAANCANIDTDNALYFTDSVDYMPEGDFSISCWLQGKDDNSDGYNLGTNASYQNIWSVDHYGKPNKTWFSTRFYRLSTSYNRLVTSTEEGDLSYVSDTAEINSFWDEGWHHFAITRKDGIITHYFDGVQQGPDVTIRFLPSLKNSDLWLFGVMANGSDNQFGLASDADSMNVDEFYIWNTALTTSDIELLYNNGGGLFYNPTNFFKTVFSTYGVQFDLISAALSKDVRFSGAYDVDGLYNLDASITPKYNYLNSSFYGFWFRNELIANFATIDSAFNIQHQHYGIYTADSLFDTKRQLLMGVRNNLHWYQTYESTIASADSLFLTNRDIYGIYSADANLSSKYNMINSTTSGFITERDFESNVFEVYSTLNALRSITQSTDSSFDVKRDIDSLIKINDSSFGVNFDVKQSHLSTFASKNIWYARTFGGVICGLDYYGLVITTLAAKYNILFGSNCTIPYKRHYYLPTGYELWDVTSVPHQYLDFVLDDPYSNTLTLTDLALADGDYKLELRPQKHFWTCRNGIYLNVSINAGSVAPQVPPSLSDVNFGNMWFGTAIYFKYVSQFNTLEPDEFGFWFSTTTSTPSTSGIPDATLTATGPDDYQYIYENHTVSPTYVAICARSGGVNGPVSYLTLTLPDVIYPDGPEPQFGIASSDNNLLPPEGGFLGVEDLSDR